MLDAHLVGDDVACCGYRSVHTRAHLHGGLLHHVHDLFLRRTASHREHRASAHRGTSLVEVFQNCWVYNDKVFANFTDKSVAADRQIFVEHGRPLVFGKDQDKGIRLRSGTVQPEIVSLNDDGVSIDDVLVHDETDRVLAGMLAAMVPPDFPVAVGVLLCEPAEISFHEAVHAQVDRARDMKGPADLDALFRQGYTWEI